VLRTLACALLLVASSVQADGSAGVLSGYVRRVMDGDSLILRSAGRDIELRLAEIDTPERGQPYAENARRALQGMLLGRRIRAEVLERDRYGRTVARVYRLPEGLWVNEELVRRGHAWAYRGYVRDPQLYEVEREAREHRRGLWALPEAEREAPWEWRKAHPAPARRDQAASISSRRSSSNGSRTIVHPSGVAAASRRSIAEPPSHTA
jgi:endonuclease YncB( thermonuclease family)